MNDTIAGNLHVANDVLADMVGNAALECYGVVGMAAPNAADGIAQILPASRLRRGVVALVFALVDQLLLAVLPLWGEQSIVALYGEGYGPGLLGFAWTLAFNLAIVFLSYALVVLHGRVGKAPFLLGLLAFGLLAFVLVPTVFQVVPGAADAAGAVLLPALGFTAQGIVLANPIVLFAVVAVLSALAAYLLTRRAEVR